MVAYVEAVIQMTLEACLAVVKTVLILGWRVRIKG